MAIIRRSVLFGCLTSAFLLQARQVRAQPVPDGNAITGMPAPPVAPSVNGPSPEPGAANPRPAPRMVVPRPAVPPAAVGPAPRPDDRAAFGGGLALPDLARMTPEQRRIAIARLTPEQRALLRRQRQEYLARLPPEERPVFRRRRQELFPG